MIDRPPAPEPARAGPGTLIAMPHPRLIAEGDPALAQGTGGYAAPAQVTACHAAPARITGADDRPKDTTPTRPEEAQHDPA